MAMPLSVIDDSGKSSFYIQISETEAKKNKHVHNALWCGWKNRNKVRVIGLTWLLKLPSVWIGLKKKITQVFRSSASSLVHEASFRWSYIFLFILKSMNLQQMPLNC